MAGEWVIRDVARKSGVTPQTVGRWVRKQGWERTGRAWVLDDEQAHQALVHFARTRPGRTPAPKVECVVEGCERLRVGRQNVCRMHYRRRARTGRTEKSTGGARQLEKTHCPAGHPYNEENTYRFPSDNQTRRRCRTCRIAQATAWKRRRTTA